MEEWVTTQTAARSLAVSDSRIRAMASDGLLVSEKRGRDLMVSTLSVTAQKSDYGQLSTPVRIRVFLRDSLTCQSCGFADGDPSSFHVHHKQPRSEGGTNALDNLTTLCCDCHKRAHERVITAGGNIQFNCRLEDEIRVLIASEAERISRELGKKVSQADVVSLAMVKWCSLDGGGGAPRENVPEDRRTAAEAAMRSAETSPPTLAPKASPRTESVAQRKARESKEHAAALAESDTVARMVGRNDIDYDLEHVPHRSVAAIGVQSAGSPEPKILREPAVKKSFAPLTRPHGKAEAKRRREQ